MIKLLFYNTDLSAWTDYVMVVEYLRIERQNGMDEMQIVADDEGLEFRLMNTFCCHAVEPANMSMWVIDKSTIKSDRSDGSPKVSFTLYEPIWILNKRVAARHPFSQTLLSDFVNAVIMENMAGQRAFGAIDLSALALLPAVYLVTRNVDGDMLADMLLEEFGDRGMKLFLTMNVAEGLSFKAGIQTPMNVGDMMLSPLLGNMQINFVSATNELGAVYVSGEYRVSDGDPVPMRGYHSFGDTGTGLEEYYTQTNKSSDGMTKEEFQAHLDSEARRIATKRTFDVDISIVSSVMERIMPAGRFNRAGLVLPADINGKLSRYIVDEVKTTSGGTNIGISEYKE